jgi:hypothetical protein
MEDDELKKYKGIVSRIAALKEGIERYLHGGADDVDGISYGHALKSLSNLRALQRMTPKKVRERYAQSKEIQRDRVETDPSSDT